MTDKEAIDNLEKYIDLVLNKKYCDCNELNVISTGGYCDGSKNVAASIQTLINRITKLEKIEAEHQKTNGKLRVEVQRLEKSLCGHDEIIARLEEDNTRKDKIIDEIARFIEVNEFDATLLDEYCPDDYGNCRHPNDSEGCIKCIKEYFTKKASEK